MAEKIHRIKASDSKKADEAKSSKTVADASEEVSRKVTVKAKNSDNKKLAAKKKAEVAEKEKKAKKSEKAEAKKAQKKHNIIVRFLLWITTPFRAIGRYIKESFQEIRQVRWPNRKETWKLTFSVIFYIIIIGGLIMILDMGLNYLTNLILGGGQ